jgi:hypothetical protein
VGTPAGGRAARTLDGAQAALQQRGHALALAQLCAQAPPAIYACAPRVRPAAAAAAAAAAATAAAPLHQAALRRRVPAGARVTGRLAAAPPLGGRAGALGAARVAATAAAAAAAAAAARVRRRGVRAGARPAAAPAASIAELLPGSLHGKHV